MYPSRDPGAPDRPPPRAWALLLGAGSLVLLLVLALLVWLAERTPEGRALAREVARSTPRRVDVRPGDDATALHLAVFDRDGAPVAGLALGVRPCEADAPVEEVITGARGEAQVSLAGCAELQVEDPDWHLLGPARIPLGPPRVRARVEVARVCPGTVEVRLAREPLAGRAYLFPGGFGALDADGVLDLAGRLCGPVDAWVVGPGSPESRERWELRGLRVEPGEPLRIDLEGVAPRTREAPREVAVHFEGGDHPDQVRAGAREPCLGEGADWTCACDTVSDCRVEAWWQEALYDWRFVKEEVARVPPGQDAVSIDLDRWPADLRATWTGPQPCRAWAVDEAHGAEVTGECLPDGTAEVRGLRAGAWRVGLAWSGGEEASSVQALRVVEMTGEDQDLGEVGPD